MTDAALWFLALLATGCGLGGLALRFAGHRAGPPGRFFSPGAAMAAELDELEWRQAAAEEQAALVRVRHAWLAQRAETEEVAAQADTAAASARQDGHTEWAESVAADASDMRERLREFDRQLDELEARLRRPLAEAPEDPTRVRVVAPRDEAEVS